MSDGKSNQFWRARTDGDTMYVNFGRIGTNGQTQVKEFGSASESSASFSIFQMLVMRLPQNPEWTQRE